MKRLSFLLTIALFLMEPVYSNTCSEPIVVSDSCSRAGPAHSVPRCTAKLHAGIGSYFLRSELKIKNLTNARYYQSISPRFIYLDGDSKKIKAIYASVRCTDDRVSGFLPSENLCKASTIISAKKRKLSCN